MQQLRWTVAERPDDLLPEDLLTDEQPRARSPPRIWWKPDDTTSWRDFFFLLFVYSLPALTILLRDC
jgi:hypothetical protein